MRLVAPGWTVTHEATHVAGFLSWDDLDAMRRAAERCDGRPTRCRSCVTILSLITHIGLIDGRMPPRSSREGHP
jgi:hypothetical protein